MPDTLNTFLDAMNETDSDTLTVLKGDVAKLAEGNFVLTGQTLATDKGFRNVSHLWYDKTISYEDGIEQLEKERAKTEDITCPIGDMVPTVKDGKFVFLHRPSERYFTPTIHAMNQVGNWAGTGTWYVNQMLENPADVKGRQLYARDEEDANTLSIVLRNGLRRVQPDKKFLFRTHSDGTLRAMLTDRYAVVDNRWLVEKFKEFIPSGRLSHWKGDGDTIWGNILIPDTIRAELDSEYGGMLSVGNCEIGTRRVSSMPSIFRAICMNGCIWGQTKGKGIKQVHRGKIELASLALEIKSNLNAQIPLLPTGIDKLLGLRTMGWDGAEAKTVIAAVAKDYKMSKPQARKVLDAYSTEAMITPELAKTLFGITNSITRAGQKLSNAEWLSFDEIGGELTEYSNSDFQSLVARAKSFNVKEVEEVFA